MPGATKNADVPTWRNTAEFGWTLGLAGSGGAKYNATLNVVPAGAGVKPFASQGVPTGEFSPRFENLTVPCPWSWWLMSTATVMRRPFWVGLIIECAYVFIINYWLTVLDMLWLKFVKEPLAVVTSLAVRTAYIFGPAGGDVSVKLEVLMACDTLRKSPSSPFVERYTKYWAPDSVDGAHVRFTEL